MRRTKCICRGGLPVAYLCLFLGIIVSIPVRERSMSLSGTSVFVQQEPNT